MTSALLFIMSVNNKSFVLKFPENSHAAPTERRENRMIGYVQMPPISFKEENWTFFSFTQNLAAVLNDPNERKRSKEFFTKTWGAEFEPCEVPPLTLLQAVPKHYFSDYIRKFQFVSVICNEIVMVGTRNCQQGCIK